MKTSELSLNDFEGFDRFIFGDGERDWSKLCDVEEDSFTPPVPYPESEVEYQIDHYAMWMCIAKVFHEGKPSAFIDSEAEVPSNYLTWPICRCYACCYAHIVMVDHIRIGTDICLSCPIVAERTNSDRCFQKYIAWKEAINCGGEGDELAEEIARIPWKIF